MTSFASTQLPCCAACRPSRAFIGQRGGTFLGLVIGLVVGLAMALAVAVYVTKVPVPFVNKGQSRSADQDAAEAKKNKDWDPNAPLYGKNPAKPTPVIQSPASTASAVPGPVAASASSPSTPSSPVAAAKTPAASEPKVDAKADTKPAASADPLGDLARAKSSNSAPDPFTYFVQAGAYRTPEDAEAQRAKLSLGGFEAKVSEREQSGRAVFRVRIGPFERKDEADKVKEKLDANGLDTAMVRVQR